tara:strand:+ start:968 stop:2857 length:1890 start_codon:yes stop_codon:yes gene_type:complete
MAPSFSGVWKLQTKYQYSSAFPVPPVNALLGGGYTGSAAIAHTQTLNFNDGNGTDQGDLSVARYDAAGFSSTTRAVFAGGYASSAYTNVVDYIEHATLGNATDFGDATVAAIGYGSHSSDTRGLVSGFNTADGVNTVNKTIDYYTIASTGNASDFGDLSTNRNSCEGGGNTTRALWFAGYAWGSAAVNVIDYVTVASTGTARDFGDTSNSIYRHKAGVNSETRSVIYGGYNGSSHLNVIEYVTIQTFGNAVDFGDLDQAQSARGRGVSNGTIGILVGDQAGTSGTTQKITIASTGNASDFGTLQIYGGSYYGYNGSASPFSPSVDALPALPSAGNTGLMVQSAGSFIESIDIASAGNSVAFGDISYTSINGGYGGAASATRMCVAGGLYSGYRNNIDLTIFATRGLGTDFGDLTVTRITVGASNSTRGIYGGGKDSGGSRVDTIDYITIASASNATDFGNLVEALETPGMAGNSTRMLFMGGRKASGSGTGGYSNQIGYVTISSTGNTTDFGDLLETNGFGVATSSSTRVVHCGGYTGAAGLNRIQYLTTASTGDATDFGDLLSGWSQGGAFSNSTKALVLGGYNWTTSANQDVIQQFTIASTGDSTDFGDLLVASGGSGQSNGHGGLS